MPCGRARIGDALPPTALWVLSRAFAELCSQANKALAAHSKERDAWKQEADRAGAEARKVKDRLEEMAYKINGLARGAL